MVSLTGGDGASWPRPVNRHWFGRGFLLGAAGGATIGLGLLLLLTAVAGDGWAILLPAAVIGAPIGALAGALDAGLALAVVGLIGSAARARIWPAALVAGVVAAVIPLLVTFHDGWPRAAGGGWIGLGLSASAFMSGLGLTPIALRPSPRP